MLLVLSYFLLFKDTLLRCFLVTRQKQITHGLKLIVINNYVQSLFVKNAFYLFFNFRHHFLFGFIWFIIDNSLHDFKSQYLFGNSKNIHVSYDLLSKTIVVFFLLLCELYNKTYACISQLLVFSMLSIKVGNTSKQAFLTEFVTNKICQSFTGKLFFSKN